MKYWGCLVMLIPLTILTVAPAVWVTWTIIDSIIHNGWKMGPTGQALTQAMICFAISINVPTTILWWIYFTAPKPPPDE